MKDIITYIIFQVAAAFIVYLLLNTFPGMQTIFQPIYSQGKVVTEIKDHSYRYITITNGDDRFDITEKVTTTAFIFYFLIITSAAHYFRVKYSEKYKKDKLINPESFYDYASKPDINKIAEKIQSTPHNETPRLNYPELELLIVNQLKNDEKLKAVKMYRASTGKGLKESVEAVEQIAIKNGIIPK